MDKLIESLMTVNNTIYTVENDRCKLINGTNTEIIYGCSFVRLKNGVIRISNEKHLKDIYPAGIVGINYKQ